MKAYSSSSSFFSSPGTFDLSLYTPYGARYRVVYEIHISSESQKNNFFSNNNFLIFPNLKKKFKFSQQQSVENTFCENTKTGETGLTCDLCLNILCVYPRSIFARDFVFNTSSVSNVVFRFRQWSLCDQGYQIETNCSAK